MVKSIRCPNENTSNRGPYFPLCASGGMYSEVPGVVVRTFGVAPGQRSMIQELPKSAILALCWESSSIIFSSQVLVNDGWCEAVKEFQPTGSAKQDENLFFKWDLHAFRVKNVFV